MSEIQNSALLQGDRYLPKVFLPLNDWTLIGFWWRSTSLKITAVFKSIEWCRNFNQSVHVILSRQEELNNRGFLFISKVWNPPLISSQFHLQRDWKVKKEESVRDSDCSFSCCVYINWLEKPYCLLPVCCWRCYFLQTSTSRWGGIFK